MYKLWEKKKSQINNQPANEKIMKERTTLQAKGCCCTHERYLTCSKKAITIWDFYPAQNIGYCTLTSTAL
jgi:hypothetical protein